MERQAETGAHRVRAIFSESARVHEMAGQCLSEVIAAAAMAVTDAFRAGNKVLLCGNGGSAADAQHIAAELAGRLRLERGGLPAIALTVNPSVMTALANDYGYDMVFARQVEALGRKGDVLVGISTSGRSASVACTMASSLSHTRAGACATSMRTSSKRSALMPVSSQSGPRGRPTLMIWYCVAEKMTEKS